MTRATALRRLGSPLLVAVVAGMVATLAMFFAAATALGGDDHAQLHLGPLTFITIAHESLGGGGSTVSVRPGSGLALFWALLLGYGGALGWWRARRAP